MSQEEIKRIYERAMIKRSQREKQLQERRQKQLELDFWGYADARMQEILKNIMKLYQIPGIPKEHIDRAQREFSEFLDVINMNTLPEVIDELVLMETRKKFQEKTMMRIDKADL